MGIEIERKFLVKENHNIGLEGGKNLAQGYLQADGERTVRVRIANDKAFLTIKGKTVGFSRSEFEYEIPVEDAKQILPLSLYPMVEKVRVEIPVEKHIWEVDFFSGKNEGLILAEIELGSEDETFDLPDWIAEEVTGDQRYYNSHLSKNPFSEWPNEKE